MLNLRKEVQKLLEKNEYVTCRYHGCFDIAAKKDNLLLLKVLFNVDSFQEKQAKNLKIISKNLNAHPLVVGMRTRREMLQVGIVYERFELPTVSLKTFENLICYSIFPKIYRDRGGLYVEIDSKLLRESRKRKGLTQRELAEAVGINKKVIYEHEKIQLRMVLNIAQKLEAILNKKLIKPVNIFKKFEERGEPKDSLEKRVGGKFETLGFQTDYVGQAPLDIFAKEKVLIISDVEMNKKRMIRRAVNLKSFLKVVKKPAILITEKVKKDNIFGIPVLKREKLEEIESKEEVIEIAKESL